MKLLMVLLTVAALGRCATREYSVVIMNDTDRIISDASVMFDGFKSIGGWVAPHVFKVHGSVTRPIPERAVVQWKTADGVLHRQEVAVRSVLPKGSFSGNVYFLIRSDNTVSVTFDDHPQ